MDIRLLKAADELLKNYRGPNNPVLTKRQLRRRREHEVPLSDMDALCLSDKPRSREPR